MEYITKNVAKTLKLAKKLAKSLMGGEIIILNGDLGAGKTVFAQGIAKGLKISERVVSPTFSIMNVYKGRLKMYHFDFYRIDSGDYELGFDEFFGLPDTVSVIEWNKYKHCHLQRIITVDIDYVDEHTRRIKIYENFMR